MISAVGIDFDNTIACYDEIFHRVALEKGLIPPGIPQTKENVKNYFLNIGKEGIWTELQGHVYGTRMIDVSPFPGVISFLTQAVKKNMPIYIVSHKTRFPYKGPKYDLCEAAFKWLDSQGFFDKNHIGLNPDRVYFKETKEEKLKQIKEIECSHFIDDLPEILLEEEFPNKTKRLLFSPGLSLDTSVYDDRLEIFRSWHEIGDYFRLKV